MLEGACMVFHICLKVIIWHGFPLVVATIIRVFRLTSHAAAPPSCGEADRWTENAGNYQQAGRAHRCLIIRPRACQRYCRG